MTIVYCAACGRALRETDFHLGTARLSGNEFFCLPCLLGPPESAAVRLRPRARRRRTRLLER